jgi:hypothetical protein
LATEQWVEWLLLSFQPAPLSSDSAVTWDRKPQPGHGEVKGVQGQLPSLLPASQHISCRGKDSKQCTRLKWFKVIFSAWTLQETTQRECCSHEFYHVMDHRGHGDWRSRLSHKFLCHWGKLPIFPSLGFSIWKMRELDSKNHFHELWILGCYFVQVCLPTVLSWDLISSIALGLSYWSVRGWN